MLRVFYAVLLSFRGTLKCVCAAAQVCGCFYTWLGSLSGSININSMAPNHCCSIQTSIHTYFAHTLSLTSGKLLLRIKRFTVFARFQYLLPISKAGEMKPGQLEYSFIYFPYHLFHSGLQGVIVQSIPWIDPQSFTGQHRDKQDKQPSSLTLNLYD